MWSKKICDTTTTLLMWIWSLLLTFNILSHFFWCFYCWLGTSNCWLSSKLKFISITPTDEKTILIMRMIKMNTVIMMFNITIDFSFLPLSISSYNFFYPIYWSLKRKRGERKKVLEPIQIKYRNSRSRKWSSK